MDDSVLLNEFEQLRLLDPVEFLRGLRRAELKIMTWNLPEKIRTLRSREHRHHLEARQAALFACGMEAVLGGKVGFAMREDADYDFVAAHLAGD